MAEQTETPPAGYNYVSYGTEQHPIAGLSRVVRHITGHDSEGRSVFLSTDIGDHHRTLGEKQAISNIIYSTNQTPVELNGDHDIEFARNTEVSSLFSLIEDVKLTALSPVFTSKTAQWHVSSTSLRAWNLRCTAPLVLTTASSLRACSR